MIELGLSRLAYIDRLPVNIIVAGQAILTEAAFVLIFMASNTSGREAKVRPIEILDLEGRAILRRDARGVVALAALEARMFAFEQVSRFLVIESSDIPLHQGKFFAVMLRVAPGALLARAGRNVVAGVQSPASRNPSRNFGVTVQTFESCLAAKLMAAGTIRRSVQRLVGP